MTARESPRRVVIVSPALADANNGNWQTAQRWASFLPKDRFQVRIIQSWPDALAEQLAAHPAARQDEVMLALHARRSAGSIAAWAARPAKQSQGLAVVLTGTDLYRDIAHDSDAQTSLVLAQHLVVLQERGLAALPEALRPKARVIFQSSTALAPVAKPAPHTQLRAVMVGHLRAEKSPATLFEAARLLADVPQLFIDHIGQALDPALGTQAQATAAACPNYRWLGSQPHKATRRHIQRAHVLVHTSAMEGGAHVIMEAVQSGTPVLVSRIDGNVGMLGEGYAGYFEPGDAAGLAALLTRCKNEDPTAPGALMPQLQAQCAARAALFVPAAEQASVLALMDALTP
jgi:putative glycosyltransferase (TIGR04348 family)